MQNMSLATFSDTVGQCHVQTNDGWLGQTNLLLRFIGGMVGYYHYILRLRCFT